MSVEQYPWCEKNWTMLWHQYQAGRLPHALLLAGQAGLGKVAFAKQLAMSLLCQGAREAGACGHCRQCKLWLADNHPDMLWVAPEEAGKAIPVDKIRALPQFVMQTAQQQGNKVIVIEAAEQMNIAASNALLKTLEEPTANTFLLLITDHPAKLLATIRSRCQHVTFHVPPAEMVAQWLQTEGAVDETLLELAGGAPRLAQQLAEEDRLARFQQLLTDWQALSESRLSPYQLAAQWNDQDDILLLMQRAVLGLLKRAACQQDLAPYQFVKTPVTRVTHQALYHYLDVLNIAVRQQARHHLNKQLLLEALLITWCEEVLG